MLKGFKASEIRYFIIFLLKLFDNALLNISSFVSVLSTKSKAKVCVRSFLFTSSKIGEISQTSVTASMVTFDEAHLISLGSSGIASILNMCIETFSSRCDTFFSYQKGKRPQKCIFLHKTFSRTMHSAKVSSIVFVAHVALANHKEAFPPCGNKLLRNYGCHIWRVENRKWMNESNEN